MSKNQVPVGSVGRDGEIQNDLDSTLPILLGEVGVEIREYHMGRILTLIDTALPESTQSKALKDLIRQEIGQLDIDTWKMINRYSREYGFTKK